MRRLTRWKPSVTQRLFLSLHHRRHGHGRARAAQCRLRASAHITAASKPHCVIHNEVLLCNHAWLKCVTDACTGASD